MGSDILDKIREDYQYLLDELGEDKIISRYKMIYSYLEKFILQNALQEKVSILRSAVDHMIVDYFVDVLRLKEFHEMKRINETKICAYSVFWLLRHKPLQVLSESNEEDYCFINEDMAAAFLKSHLFQGPANIAIIDNKLEEMNEFTDTLEYYFRYREYNAKSIELLILAFQGGRAYQYSVDYQN